MPYIWRLLVSFAVVTLCAAKSSHWRVQERADPEAIIKLHIRLRPQDGQFGKTASDIANPTHPRFRRYLTQVELQGVLQPAPTAVDDVHRWLRQYDVANFQYRGNMIDAYMTVAQAEDLLETSYYVYTDGERSVIRTNSYSVPESLKCEVDFVAPTTTFPGRRRVRVSSSSSDWNGARRLDRRIACGSEGDTTPACIRQLYNITYNAQPNRTTFAVYATEAASYSSADAHTFLEQYNPPAAAANAGFEVVGVGDPADGSPGIDGAFETHLDTQTSLGLAWPATGILYTLGGVFGPNAGQTYDPLVQFLQGLIHNKTVPSVVTFSEGMPEDQVDPSYAQSLCEMMAQVGARGVTLLFSSGDNGPQGDQPSGKHNAVFEPEFPASCPYVLSVGGTTNMATETAATQETITGAISKLSYTASGGGFSNLFARPTYQDNVVKNYITTSVPASYQTQSGFNSSGRGIPDVSALSTNFPVLWNGINVPISGTSASTPLWAAIITLLNDYEASQGRPPLGFVNPWLYSLGSHGLHDITTGGNNVGACNLLAGCTLSETLGFNVTAGWDPVTGLGSPIFSTLSAALDETAALTAIVDESRNLLETGEPMTHKTWWWFSAYSTALICTFEGSPFQPAMQQHC